jgi:hypothetical protein
MKTVPLLSVVEQLTRFSPFSSTGASQPMPSVVNAPIQRRRGDRVLRRVGPRIHDP